MGAAFISYNLRSEPPPSRCGLTPGDVSAYAGALGERNKERDMAAAEK